MCAFLTAAPAVGYATHGLKGRTTRALQASAFCGAPAPIARRGAPPLRRVRTPVPALQIVAAAEPVAGDSGGDGGDGDLLASPDFVQRIKGVNEARTRFSDAKGVVAALLPLAAADANPQVRYMAISQLAGLDAADLGEDDGVRLLDTCTTMLREDTDPSCQAGAADAIAGLRLQEGFDTLVDTFNNTSDWMLRFTIAAGVGVMNNPRSFEFLTAVLDAAQPEGDELLVAATIGALADLGNTDALPIIAKYREHPDASVQERASIAHEVLSKA